MEQAHLRSPSSSRFSHWMSRPGVLLVGAFGGLIVLGALLLILTDGLTPLDALFTATSAVCVTGLNTVVGGAASLSRPGQWVVLVLMQCGGLGIMTFGAVAAQLFRRSMSFSSQAALQEVFFQSETTGRLSAALRRIVLLVLLCEGAGAVAIYLGMDRGAGDEGVFEAVFLAVSAFCNAGFSVYADSVERFRDSGLVLTTIMLLIVVGGLGYMVLFELLDRARQRLRGAVGGAVHMTLNTRVVLAGSVVLIVGGAAALALTGMTSTERVPMSIGVHALFQSITARTAGFNTVDIAALPMPALLVIIGLMFIGGSPGSCAGGVKTTSYVVWLARLRARLLGREHVNIGERHIPHEVVRRAALIIGVSALWNLVGVLVLSITELKDDSLVDFEHVIFEQVSAFATVGLSAGLTPELSAFGKLWIIASMFVGRLGPLTIALAVMPAGRQRVSYPVERVMIG